MLSPARRFSRSALVALAALVIASPFAARAQSAPRGRWSLERDTRHDRLQLSFRALEQDDRHNGMTSFGVAPSELTGLSTAALDGSGDSASFRMVRGAGTLTFEGRVGHGLGIGIYTFTPNTAFLDDLARRGYGRATDQEALRLALSGIGTEYVARLDALKYERPTIGELVRLGNHGVTLDYLDDMASLGFASRSASEITRLRDHGVDAPFVRDLTALGFAVEPQAYIRARDHGVTPEYVRDLKAAGYTDLTPEDYVRARDHGVDAKLARDFAAVGYAKLPIQTLVRMTDHGVTPSYAKAYRRDGTAPTPEELVRARDHGER